MKTIQIPTSSNPCIVVINNTAYSYRAGDTVEVPDEVAEVIEAHTEVQHTAKPQHTEVQQASDLSAIGGATKEWQRLIDMELTEAINAVTADVDVKGTPFEVSELIFRAYMPAVTGGGASYLCVGTSTKSLRYYFSQGLVAYMGGHIVIAEGAMHHVDGLISTTNEFAYKLNPPYGEYYDGVTLGTDKISSIRVGLSNFALNMPVGTKIKVYGR